MTFHSQMGARQPKKNSKFGQQKPYSYMLPKQHHTVRKRFEGPTFCLSFTSCTSLSRSLPYPLLCQHNRHHLMPPKSPATRTPIYPSCSNPSNPNSDPLLYLNSRHSVSSSSYLCLSLEDTPRSFVELPSILSSPSHLLPTPRSNSAATASAIASATASASQVSGSTASFSTPSPRESITVHQSPTARVPRVTQDTPHKSRLHSDHSMPHCT